MNKQSCELIKDLLPLYADDVCSSESRAAVAEHIAECISNGKLTSPVVTEELSVAGIEALETVKKGWEHD